MFAFTARTYARWAANIFLFLSILLTVFFLTGTTSNSPAVRGLYAMELSYKNAPIPTKTAAGSASTMASAARTPGPSRTIVATRATVATAATAETTAATTNTRGPGTSGANTSAGSALESVGPVSSNTFAATSTPAASAATQKPPTAQTPQPSELKKRQLVLDTSPPPVRGRNGDGSYKLNPDGSYTFVQGLGDLKVIRKIRALAIAKVLNKAKAEIDLKIWKAKQKTMGRRGGRAPRPDSRWTFYDPELRVTKTEDLLAKRTAIPRVDGGDNSSLKKRFVPGPEYLLAFKPRTTFGAKITTTVYAYAHNKVTVPALAECTAAATNHGSHVEHFTAEDLYADAKEPTTTSPSLVKRLTMCERIRERNPFMPKWLCPDPPPLKYKMYTIVKNYGADVQYSKTVSIPLVKRSAAPAPTTAPELHEAVDEDDSSLDKREPNVYEIVEDLGGGETETHTVPISDFPKRSADPEAELNHGTPPSRGNIPKHYIRSEDDLEGVYEIVEEFEDGKKETRTVELPVATGAPDAEPADASLDKRQLSSLYVSKTQCDALMRKYKNLLKVQKREADNETLDAELAELELGGATAGGWRSYLDIVSRMKRIRKPHPNLPTGVYKREYLGTLHRRNPTSPTSHLYKRHPIVDATTPLSVSFSYYGLCASSATTTCRRDEIGGLPPSADPLNLLALAGDLQSTLSPAITITALVLLGVSWLLYIYICVRPATRRCRRLFFATCACAVVALLHAASVLNTVGQTAVDVLSTTGGGGGVVLVARKGVRVVAVGVVAAVLAGCALSAVVAGDRSGADKRREAGDEERNGTDEIVDIYASMNTPKLMKDWGVRQDGVELPPGDVPPAPMWGTMRGGVV